MVRQRDEFPTLLALLHIPYQAIIQEIHATEDGVSRDDPEDAT